MRRAGLLVAFAALLAGAIGVGQSQERTFDVRSKNEGHLLSDRYPTQEFRLDLTLTLEGPGSVLDTVGIDAAPVGSWSVTVGADGVANFQLWDGRKWHIASTKPELEFGRPTDLLLKREGRRYTISVGRSSAWLEIDVPLSGKPVYVGDYPPDAHWGSGYNIHQGAVGRVVVRYFGPPRDDVPAPQPGPGADADFGARIVDEAGIVSEGERRLLISGLQAMKANRGIDLAVAFLRTDDLDQGKAELKRVYDSLTGSRVLPPASGVLGYGGEFVRLYRYSTVVGNKLGWDEVNGVWQALGEGGTTPFRMAQLLHQLAGKPLGVIPGPVPPGPGPQPDPTPKPAPGPGPTPGGLPTAGEGRAAITEAGGVVTSGQVRVEIPAGALSRPDTLVVQQGVMTDLGEAGVRIEFQGGDQTLMKPATINFPIPAGSDPKRLVALRSLGPNAWVTMPLEVDASAGVARAKTHHFCDGVILDLGKTKAKIVGSFGAGLGGAILLKAVGLAPVTSGASVLVAIPFLLTGWALGGAAYNSAQAKGLVGSYVSPGFRVFWDPNKVPSDPYAIALVDGRNGNLITWTKDTARPTTPTIGPATSPPKSTVTYERGGYTFEVLPQDLVEFRVPTCVMTVAGDLSRARDVYQAMGLQVPEELPVYLYDKVGQTPVEKNSGLWDGEVLGLNSTSLEAEPPNSQDSRSASAHEYFHAVVSHNGFSQRWTGQEEAMAVAMESLVWSTTQDAPLPEIVDFHGQYSWLLCTDVLRSGLFRVAPNEGADSRGYYQWPILKYAYHKYGKGMFLDLLNNRLPREKLDELLAGFTRAALVEDAEVQPRMAISDIPAIAGASSFTGWEGHSLVTASSARALKFGPNSGPMPHPGSINAYVVPLPAVPAGTPPSPLVVRRQTVPTSDTFSQERVFVGKPTADNFATVKSADLKDRDMFFVTPPEWDQPGANMIVALAAYTVPKMQGGGEDPLLVYRLAPPVGVEVEHLQATSDDNAKSRFSFTPPAPGGSLSPGDVVAAYRLYGRKSGREELLAEFVLDKSDAPAGWYAGSSQAIKIPPGTEVIDLPIARMKVIEYDEFAMSSVDGLMKDGGQPLESPASWQAKSDVLAALAKCTDIYFSASVGMAWTTVSKMGDNAEQTQTTTFPATGAFVNPPDRWGFGSNQYKGKLTVNGPNFEFKFTGELKYKGEAVSAGSLMDALEGFNPFWPFAGGSQIDGTTTITLSGQLSPDGKLIRASYKVEHPQYGCTMNLADVMPSTLKLEGDVIEISYSMGEDGSAKTSGHSAWFNSSGTNWYSNSSMTKFNKTTGFVLKLFKPKT